MVPTLGDGGNKAWPGGRIHNSYGRALARAVGVGR